MRWLLQYGVPTAATLVLLLLSTVLVYNQREDGYRLAQASIRSSARVLANQVQNSFDQVDALLLSVGLRYESALGEGPAGLQRLKDQVLREVPHYPLVRRVAILDRNGFNFFNTGVAAQASPPLNAADRSYFLRAREGTPGPIFEGPVLAKLDGEWSMIVARRIEDGSGSFLGVAVAILPSTTIGASFSGIDLGDTGSVNLRGADLTQIARYPALTGANSGIGNRNISQTIQDLMRAHPGQDHYLYTTVAPIDGIERLYTYQKLARAPFWITVGLATNEFGSSWRQTSALLAAIGVPVVWLLFWSARRVHRHNELLQQGIEASTRTLAESERFVREMTDHWPSTIAYWTPQLRCSFANRALRRASAGTDAPVPGASLAELLGPERAQLEQADYARALAGTAQTFERPIIRPDGSVQTLLVSLTPDLVGNRVQGLFEQSTDISTLKQAETELRRQQDNLR